MDVPDMELFEASDTAAFLAERCGGFGHSISSGGCPDWFIARVALAIDETE